ncbi:MAG: recombinase family protein [Clostridiales bacterium]|nr:recombinase family protein [Clostridiales bacterium]
MKKYRIAIYMRLSKEDDRFKEESNSIAMQRMLLQKYAADHFSDYDLMEFCDDGYTGTNFNRPGVQSMLEKVRDSQIDCIIVKDFSRFARDYIELGSYLEQIFAFMGVRFISVNDCYDSKAYQGSIADIDINFRNLLYDLYSKDLSGKVRASLAVRKEQGQYVSGNSPFGYEKDPQDRHALLIEEDEAEVVRRIFTLAAEGFTSAQIAKLFNETGVKTPVEFKIAKGKTSRVPKGGRFLWSTNAVCRILRNEIYIGNIVQKKYSKDFVGGKNHINPREEWLVSYNHHEPIITKEIFDRIQKGRETKQNPHHDPAHPLVGKLVCGCCGRNLGYRRGLNPYFTCPGRYSNNMKHCVKKINAMFAEQYVLFLMQNRLREGEETEQICMEAADRLGSEIQELKKKRKKLLAKIERGKRQNFENYQDYARGKTDTFQSADTAIKSAENELLELESHIREKEALYMKRDRKGVSEGINELSKDLIERYIEKVTVYDEQNIEIRWVSRSVLL